MKIKLTLRYVLSMIMVFYITMIVYTILNIVIYKGNFSFGEEVFNLSFSTRDFALEYVKDLEEDNDLRLSDENIEKLIDNNIWIQVLNKENKEVYQANKPNTIPISYSTYELVDFITDPWGSSAPTTITTNKVVNKGEEYMLLVGFPIDKVYRYKMTFTDESMLYHLSIIVFALILMTIVAYILSKYLVKPMVSVVDDINDLKNGLYKNKPIKNGVFEEVSKNINELSNVLKENETKRNEVDKVKEEWIANITHDLKTPLSSIKGYAELIQGNDYVVDIEEAKKYSSRILDNSNYIQELVNDLSLVYKLKNKVIPINLNDENIITLLQENIIDLLNNSKYADREINFNYENEKIIVPCDKKYLKRAINNIIINSLDHNSKGTVVNVSILEEKGRIKIIIEDNGQGIKEENIIYIFDRYYKGVNSNSSYKGSGLGMAIAKEIIIYHSGNINIESEVGVGTKITIVL